MFYDESNKDENLSYFFKTMDFGGYTYNDVLKDYIIPRAIKIAERLDDILHSEGLFADHTTLEHCVIGLLMKKYPKEDVEYKLGNINLKENVDLHLKRTKEECIKIPFIPLKKIPRKKYLSFL